MTIEELLDWEVTEPLSGPGIMPVRKLDSDGLSCLKFTRTLAT